MSNIPEPEFEKYLSCYNDVMNLIIDLHNRNVQFKKYKGQDTARQVRNVIRELIANQKLLGKLTITTYKESLENSKIRKKISRENKLKYQKKKNKIEINE